MFGRRWGKNVLGIDEAMTAALQGQRVGWFEPTYKYLLEAWRELEFRLRPAARTISHQEKRIELITGGLVEAWTCDNPDAGRSREYDLAIINEAGLIRGLRDLWEQSIYATLGKTHGRALFLGTPKGRSHDFSLLHARAANTKGWQDFRGPTSENPFYPADEIAEAKAALPPGVFAQEYEGIPADDGGNPFGLDAILACTVTDPVEIGQLLQGEPFVFGWDFARSQDWTRGVALSKTYEVVRVHGWQGVDWGEQKARIHQLNGAVPAWGDATRSRVDDVIVQDLQRMGVPMIPVQSSAPMKQALMQRLAVCIQQRKLRIPDGPLARELEVFTYRYTSKGGVEYTAPEGMHDDCVMALALAVFGRDQFGEVPELQAAVTFEEDRHPGFEQAYAGDQQVRRVKPWEKHGWVPDKPDTRHIPSKEMIPL
jgi:hypothetical protein